MEKSLRGLVGWLRNPVVDTLPLLMPGSAAPYGPIELNALADYFSVDDTVAQSWLDRGLPAGDGVVDLFSTCNWLSWHALDEAPALQRRWTIYADYFAASMQEEDGWFAIEWQRRHRLFLAEHHHEQEVRWWLPQAMSTSFQRVDEDQLDGDAGNTDGWFVANVHEPRELSGLCRVEARKQRVSADSQTCQAMYQVLEPFVATFRYLYRYHQLHDVLSSTEGSCLDVAVACGRILHAAGFRVYLCAGIIAHSMVGNPHYWLEVETDDEFVPVDASLACIARMLELDWRQWLRHWVGGYDARRIVLDRRELDAGMTPDRRLHPYLAKVPGFAMLTGSRDCADAWHCQDWVCGRTAGAFTRQRSA